MISEEATSVYTPPRKLTWVHWEDDLTQEKGKENFSDEVKEKSPDESGIGNSCPGWNRSVQGSKGKLTNQPINQSTNQ